MPKSSREYLIFVGGNRADVINYVTETRAYSRRKALRTAHKLATLYPLHDIIIEEWAFRTSHKPSMSGLYKGEVLCLPALIKQEVAA